MSNSEAKIRRMTRRLERRYPGVTVEILHRDDMNDPSGKLRNIMFTAPDKDSLIRFGLADESMFKEGIVDGAPSPRSRRIRRPAEIHNSGSRLFGNLLSSR
jgi:hypothetical protein